MKTKATIYDLMLFGKTRIQNKPLTGYEMMYAKAKFGGGFPVSTITGIPPLSFKSDGSALTAWSISGAMTQTGTPTPDAPITPEECGDKTANLWDYLPDNSTLNGVTIRNDNGVLKFSGTCDASANFQASRTVPAGTYTISANANRNPSNDENACIQVLANDFSVSAQVNNNQAATGYKSLTFPSEKGCQFRIRIQSGVNYDGFELRPMMNTGLSPLPFTPYGKYALPISCSGTTQTVYLSEPIREIGEYSDSVSSDGTVTRRIKKLVLTGKETYKNYSYGSTSGVQVTYVLDTSYKRANGLCNIYPVSTQAGSSHCLWIGSGGGDINLYFVSILSDMSMSDASEFKSWVADQYAAGTPVTVWYVMATAQTETFTAPTITPAKGANTLSVGTTLQPSEVSITGHIKAN